ncbi:hypothetical protein ANN_17178 [Periplaneta americana]|uniref:Uncharacterized protein n=1 Tax=Periplaneta americana TaxID=6978 RepID=A0ABQ8ST90_PERAM|nr:hypothetical protein ANN_17178 [Periplaneta americana]
MERKMLIITLRHRVRNEDIRSQTYLKDAAETADKLKKKWAGHVMRLNANRWIHMLTTWDPRIGKRNAGRGRQAAFGVYYMAIATYRTRTERKQRGLTRVKYEISVRLTAVSYLTRVNKDMKPIEMSIDPINEVYPYTHDEIVQTSTSKGPIQGEMRKPIKAKADQPAAALTFTYLIEGYLASECNESDNAGEMSPGSSTESYPAFARIGLRENPGKNFKQGFRAEMYDIADIDWGESGSIGHRIISDSAFLSSTTIATGVAQSVKALACRSEVAFGRGFDPSLG